MGNGVIGLSSGNQTQSLAMGLDWQYPTNTNVTVTWTPTVGYRVDFEVDGANQTTTVSPQYIILDTDHSVKAFIGSSPTDATPEPTRTKAQIATDQVFTNMYIALGLIGAGLIIISAFIMLKSMGGDFNDSNGSLVGVGLLITTLIGLVLGFVIINAFQNSMTSISLLFLHG
jgi:hypothetical protein